MAVTPSPVPFRAWPRAACWWLAATRVSLQASYAGGTGNDFVLTAANIPPVTTTSGGTTAFTEGNNVTSTPVTIDGALTVSDLDNTTLASATVAITGNFHSGEDVLAFTNNGSTMGNIAASYNAATGVMTLTSAGATATVAQWQAALRSVTYTDSSDTTEHRQPHDQLSPPTTAASTGGGDQGRQRRQRQRCTGQQRAWRASRSTRTATLSFQQRQRQPDRDQRRRCRRRYRGSHAHRHPRHDHALRPPG